MQLKICSLLFLKPLQQNIICKIIFTLDHELVQFKDFISIRIIFVVVRYNRTTVSFSVGVCKYPENLILVLS